MLRKLSILLVLVSCLLMSGCLIKGTVTDANKIGIEGVKIVLHGQEGDMTIYTDVDGNFVFNNLLSGKYTVTPISDVYDFDPVNTNAQIIQATTIANFVADRMRFIDMQNGTIIDDNTGLIWLKDASCSDLPHTDSHGRAVWDNAELAAANLEDGICGLTDGSVTGEWRQPTNDEWEAFVSSAVGYGYEAPALVDAVGTAQWSEGDAFIGVQSLWYWSSTDIDGWNVWDINMNNGELATHAKVYDDTYVWPVRDDD